MREGAEVTVGGKGRARHRGHVQGSSDRTLSGRTALCVAKPTMRAKVGFFLIFLMIQVLYVSEVVFVGLCCRRLPATILSRTL